MKTPASDRYSRRWRVPPPLTRGGELLEGAELLAELSGETAVLLWKSLRNVTLWAGAGPRELPELFAPTAQAQRLADLLAAELDEPLREPLRQIAEMLGDPAAARHEVLALACRRIAQWAGARGANGTSLAFTQAAALVCPADAQLALAVGRMARQRAEHARAESWYRRAIMLGRQGDDWSSYSLAYIGLGKLHFQRGNLPLARRAFVKSKRAAERKGLRQVKAWALHDLFTVAAEYGDLAAAQKYAAGALRAYGSRHSVLPRLAHDLAAFWALQGEFRRALPVFRAILPHASDPGTRALVLANLARSAAGVGDHVGFESAWTDALALLDQPQAEARAAQVLLNLARGAASLGDLGRAETAASRALQIATERGEAQRQFEAEAVLDAARRGHALHAPAPPPLLTEVEEAADTLRDQLLHSLEAAASAG